MSVNSKEFLERQPLLDYLEKFSKHCSRPVGTNIIEAVERHVREMPAADVAPVVRGKWKKLTCYDENLNADFQCSNCLAGDTHARGVEVPYCRKCGARMEGEEQ